MRTPIDLDSWPRKAHYQFFKDFTEPFHSVVFETDVTRAYQRAKREGHSFYLDYLHCSLRAVNEIPEFRYRIDEGQAWDYAQINASATVLRPDNTFGFSNIPYHTDLATFVQGATAEIARVRASEALFSSATGQEVIHCSALPWLNFTALSHARHFPMGDSVPKISYAKMMEKGSQLTMSVSLHAHHALVDGYHVGLFAQRYQELLDAT